MQKEKGRNICRKCYDHIHRPKVFFNLESYTLKHTFLSAGVFSRRRGASLREKSPAGSGGGGEGQEEAGR